MTQSSVSGFEPDLRLSAAPIITALAVAGVAIALAGGNSAHVVKTQPIALLILGLAIATGYLYQWKPAVGAWFLVIGIVFAIHWAGSWLQVPIAPFALLPVVLAAGLIGLPAALLTAALETVLLGLSWWLAVPAADPKITAISLIVVWCLVGLLWGIYGRVREVARWSWEHYQLASEELEDVYASRVQHEQTTADLVHANRQLTLMNEKLAATRLLADEAQKATTAFVARVSHEFRTPLNMIIGLTELPLETPEFYGRRLPMALIEDLEIVHRNSEHLASLINDVLDLSRVEAGKVALHRERVNLADVVDWALDLVRPLIEEKGLVVEVVVPSTLPELYCDRTRIRQVVVNLLANAARLTERGGITVRAKAEGAYVVVSVADTGPGIAPDVAQRIFQPFYRGSENASTDQGGSGLGLTISRQFVELHDGKMWLESTVDLGSTFFFKLPISPFDIPVAGPKARNVEDWDWHERTGHPALSHNPRSQPVLVYDETGDLQSSYARYWDEVEFVACPNLAKVSEDVQSFAARAIILNSVSTTLLYSQVEQARLAAPDLPIIGCSLPARTDNAKAAGLRRYLLKPALRADLEQALQDLGEPVRRVLLVDGNGDTRRLYTRMLRSMDAELEIETAATGAEGLARLATWRPDLMLLDIMLPDIDGWHVLAAKARDEKLCDIPVIVMSAQDPAEDSLSSRLLILTAGAGLSINKVLSCSQSFLALMQAPD